MKQIIAIVAATALAVGINSSAQTSQQMPVYGGPGLAIAGSIDPGQLPDKASKFIKKHYEDKSILRCEREFDDNTYEVTLGDGTDLEFDANGEWTEVEAGRSRTLPDKMVKELLPRKAYDELKRRGVDTKVEAIKRDKSGYKVELRGVNLDDYRFDRDGRLLRVTD